MTFDDVLAQVLALLQRQGRVSYGALKRRFGLDDAYLHDLKAELIDAQRLAVDEAGRILVWRGAPGPPSPPDPPASARPLAPPPPEAERRQLTVLFCDLVGSTALAGQLDPEDWRDVVRAYQATCATVIARFDGHIAQYLGDGVLVYFGYPVAHEDDAHRAVRTGLGILEAMGDLNQALKRDQGIQLAVRVGIHTGLVVVGEMGRQGRPEQLALGEVPHVCSRIEALAEHNTVAISAATYRLVQGYFACQDLGAQTLRGVAQPLHMYRVLGASGVHSRLDITSARGLTPLVGRESEVTLLRERWEQAKAGHGQVVLLTGDAGIGKSRLVQRLQEHVANEPHMRWECRSVSYYQHTALYPLTDFFQRTLQWQHDESPDAKLGKLEHTLSQYRLPLEETVPLFAPLLALPDPAHRYPLLHLSPQRQRQKTLEAIIAILLEQAEHHPVLFIIEDLHWTDPTTLELIGLLLDQTPTAALLVLLTCRSHFQPAWHHRSYLTELTVHRLAGNQIERMTTHVAGGKPLPTQVLAQIAEKTDGVPLFVEEITKAVLESGALQDVNGQYVMTGTFSSVAIPATLHDSLLARLDRLGTAKAVAQYAAVLGRQFSYALLQAVALWDASTLQRELGRLVEAEMVYQRGLPPQATYVFKHALIQEAAYETLLRRTRQRYHQHIAQVLESQFPETAATQPELLAHHYTEAGRSAQAIPYWQQAAERAITRSAHVEALSHLTQALALLQTLPETPARAQQELPLQLTLGVTLTATRGHADPGVGRAYARAWELCQQGDRPTQLFPVLWGRVNFYLVRAEFQTVREIAAQFFTLAQRVPAPPPMLLRAHEALGATAFFQGAFVPARAHLEQGMALYALQQDHSHDPQYSGGNPGMICLSYLAWVLWCLGYPDQALQRSQEALSLARALSHPFSLVMALDFAALFHQLRREANAARAQAAAAIALCSEQAFALAGALGTILQGWAVAEQEPGQEGMAQIRQGMATFQALGANLFQPYVLAVLAETSRTAGQLPEGLNRLAEALALVDTTGEQYYAAELYRLKGELLLACSTEPQEVAETWFHQALAVARRQQAKSWELRAAMSLSHLWQQQGKQAEARALLAPLYGWFTEGFDTADLQDAKALLDALGS